MVKKVKYDWTVIYLIQAVDMSWVAAKEMIDGIVGSRPNPRVPVLFCLNTRRRYLPGFLPACTGMEEETAADHTTVFLRVGVAEQRGSVNQLILVAEQEDFQLNDPGQLSAYFTRQVLADYAAERYLLFTWDHGAAYGLFKTQDRILTGAELAVAIQSAFGRKKIDLLIMMNCYMHFFDTCLALSAAVRYLVAAETLFYDMRPFRYSLLFAALATEPVISAAQLCRLAVDAVESRYAGQSISDPLLGMAVFGSSLRYYPLMVPYLRRLHLALRRVVRKDFALIRDCRAQCGIVPGAPIALIDWLQFIRLVQSCMPAGWQGRNLLPLSDLLEKAILQRYLHAVFEKDGQGFVRLIPGGYSVCFPTGLPDPCAADDFYSSYIKKGSPGASLFSMHCQWGQFIASYLDQQELVRTGGLVHARVL